MFCGLHGLITFSFRQLSSYLIAVSVLLEERDINHMGKLEKLVPKKSLITLDYNFLIRDIKAAHCTENIDNQLDMSTNLLVIKLW